MPLVAVSSCFELEIPASPIRDVVEEALRAVDDVHGVTPSPPLIPLDVEFGTVDAAVYRRTRNGEAVKIAIAEMPPQPRLALIHEIGHYLDHQAINEPGRFASEGSARLDGWRSALFDSAAHRRLIELSLSPPIRKDHPAAEVAREVARKHLDYLLRARECFARSYSQYIAWKSGNLRLQQELGEIQAFTYPAQWEAADFMPLATELDRLFHELGWLIDA